MSTSRLRLTALVPRLKFAVGAIEIACPESLGLPSEHFHEGQDLTVARYRSKGVQSRAPGHCFTLLHPISEPPKRGHELADERRNSPELLAEP